MPKQLAPEVTAVLDQFPARFGGYELLHCPAFTPERVVGSAFQFCRQDITVHVLNPPHPRFPTAPSTKPAAPNFDAMRDWLMAEGVMVVRVQRIDLDPVFLVGPIIPVPDLTTAYHATRATDLDSIRRDGLLPGDPSKGRASTGNRFDCYGNIYVCRALGTPADVGQEGSFSAHWWRGELARRNKTDRDRDWVILRLSRLDALGAVANRDIVSQSGIILYGIPCIPRDHIEQAWPA